MRAFVVFALLAAAVCATDPMDIWTQPPLEALDPVPFTFVNCGDPKLDVVVIKTFEIHSPMPVTSGSMVEASFDIAIVEDMHNITASLLIEKQMTKSYWIKVPCVGKVGSCKYPDVCAELANIPNCSDYAHLIGQECECPIKANTFKQEYVRIGPVPSIPALARGNFRITVQATETRAKKRAACYIATVSLK
jgi:hypothetical protein